MWGGGGGGGAEGLGAGKISSASVDAGPSGIVDIRAGFDDGQFCEGLGVWDADAGSSKTCSCGGVASNIMKGFAIQMCR